MNILVIGLAGHGKDEFAKIAEREFGLSFLSSSEFCLNRGVFDFIWEHNGFSNRSHFWLYKNDYRPQLFKAIREYNDPASRLAEEIFEHAHIYVGMRSREEFEACKAKDLFTYVIWVDAEKRLGVTETIKSNQLTKDDADIIVDNNGTVEEFAKNIAVLIEKITGVK